MKNTDLQSKDLNIPKCIENVGGSQFELVLIAAARAREIANRRLVETKDNTNLKFPIKAVTTALNDIEQGKIGREYLDKMRKPKK